MKLYKFRPLKDGNDLEMLKEIIETGKFWCSSFLDLNDPMEGVYKNPNLNRQAIDEIWNEKMDYKICSFSGEDAFKNPLMWGYYANGYKGVAIEIEIDKFPPIYPVKYLTEKKFSKMRDNVVDILTSKLTNWKHEDEYRFLGLSLSENLNLISNASIKAVYFGDPYSKLRNYENIKKRSKNYIRYKKLKKELINLCLSRKINCYTHDGSIITHD